jgi:hypothetical protein
LVRPLLLAAVLLSAGGIAHAAPAAAHPPRSCEPGTFCVWPEEYYGGTIARFDLRNTTPEQCVPLPGGIEARSFANRIDRQVTVYQDRHCSTEADFSTFPGPGTYVPRSPYVVRAIQIWE